MDTTTSPSPAAASETAELAALANRLRLQDRERRDRMIAQAVRQAGKLSRTTA